MGGMGNDAFVVYLNEQRIERDRCPVCHTKLEHFSGLENIPEYLYCPKCLDTAYDTDRRKLFNLV